MNILKLKKIEININRFWDYNRTERTIEAFNEYIDELVTQLENLITCVEWLKSLDCPESSNQEIKHYTDEYICSLISYFYELNLSTIEMARMILGTENVEIVGFRVPTTFYTSDFPNMFPYESYMYGTYGSLVKNCYIRAKFYYRGGYTKSGKYVRGNPQIEYFLIDNRDKCGYFTPNDLEEITNIKGVLLGEYSVEYIDPCLVHYKGAPYSELKRLEWLNNVSVTNLMSWKDVFLPSMIEYVKEHIEEDQKIILEAIRNSLQQYDSSFEQLIAPSIVEINKKLKCLKKESKK